MNILITGGAGFVGSSLVQKLIDNNHYVVSIDNYSTGSEDNHIVGCEYIDYDLVNGLPNLPKIDFIYHLAATARIQPSFKDPKKYFQNNVIATYNVIDYAYQIKCPIVYAGSSSHHSGRFSNPYTFTKDIGEDIVVLYQKHFNLDSAIARLYNVYGPRENISTNYATLIGNLKRCYMNNDPFIIYGDGSKKRDFTHIDDVTNALISIMNRQAYGYIFEIGRGQNFSVQEIVNMFKYNKIEYKPNKNGEATSTLCNNRLTKKILNWQPKHNIQSYIEGIINDK